MRIRLPPCAANWLTSSALAASQRKLSGDLQNVPEDIPRLVAAVEAGSDVATGRRVARRDS